MLRDTNPKHWKLVIFYYNPNESRLFVPKRTGIPFTLNFAKPMAWAILAVTPATVTLTAIINNSHFVR
jgi:uncharacterized membrane protein